MVSTSLAMSVAVVDVSLVLNQYGYGFDVLTASGTPHGDGDTLLLSGVTDEALVGC